MATELATAYINLVPSMRGAQAAITSALVPGAGAAGTQAGAAAGSGFSGGMGSALTRGAVVAGAAGVAIGAGLFKIGETFDAVTDTIRVGTGAQGQSLDALVQSAKNVGGEVPAAWDSIGTAIADINTRTGATGPALEGLATQFLELSRITGSDLSGSIASATRAFGDWGITGDQQATTLDTIFKVAQSTGASFEGLADKAVQFGGPMRQLGFSFDETVALLGNFEKQGVNTELVMGSMRVALGRMAKAGEEPIDTLQRVMAEIQNAGSAGEANALALEMFGARAGPDMAAAIREGRFSVEELMATIGGSSETILGAGADTMDFAERWLMVKNNAAAALEPLASTVFGALGDALERMMPTITTFGAWLGENTWVLGVLAGFIGVTLVAAFFAWAASIWATTIALLANPITWIILAIIAAIAAVILIVQNWGAITEWFRGIWDGIAAWWNGLWSGISEWFQNVWTSISTWIGGVWGGIKATAETVWNAILEFFRAIPGHILTFFQNYTLPGLIMKYWDDIKATAERIWNGILDFFRGIPGKIGQALSGLANLGRQLVENLGAAGRAVLDWSLTVIRNILDVPRKIAEGLGNLGQLLFNAGRNIITGLVNGITSMLGRVRETMGNIAQTIRNFLPFSPAKDGPLSGSGNPEVAGAKIASMLGAGLHKGRAGVAAEMNALMGLPGVGVGAGIGASADIGLAAGGDGGPTTIVVRDADGALVGRMRAEAGRVQSGRVSPLSEGRAAW